MTLNKLKLLVIFLLLTGVKVSSQNKDANDFFKNKALARKVNNVLSFIGISNTVNLNEYDKSIIYAIINPNHSNAFSVSLKNQLPSQEIKMLKCFKLENNRFLVFIDKSSENYGQEELFKKHFSIIENEMNSCDELFKELKVQNRPQLPENVFVYSIFEESFVYLEDLATFDVLQYLEIEYNLNKSTK